MLATPKKCAFLEEASEEAKKNPDQGIKVRQTRPMLLACFFYVHLERRGTCGRSGAGEGLRERLGGDEVMSGNRSGTVPGIVLVLSGRLLSAIVVSKEGGACSLCRPALFRRNCRPYCI